VLIPLDESSLQDAVAKLESLGVESVAACLLHAYANLHTNSESPRTSPQGSRTCRCRPPLAPKFVSLIGFAR
jgi:hypothetical protein